MLEFIENFHHIASTSANLTWAFPSILARMRRAYSITLLGSYVTRIIDFKYLVYAHNCKTV